MRRHWNACGASETAARSSGTAGEDVRTVEVFPVDPAGIVRQKGLPEVGFERLHLVARARFDAAAVE